MLIMVYTLKVHNLLLLLTIFCANQGAVQAGPYKIGCILFSCFFLFFFVMKYQLSSCSFVLEEKIQYPSRLRFKFIFCKYIFLQTMSTLIFGYHIRVVYRGTDTLNLTQVGLLKRHFQFSCINPLNLPTLRPNHSEIVVLRFRKIFCKRLDLHFV